MNMKPGDFMSEIYEECRRLSGDHGSKPPGKERYFNVPQYSVQMVRDSVIRVRERIVDHPSVIANHFRDLIGNPPQEHLWVFFLDKNNSIIGESRVSIGIVDCTVCEAKDVMVRVLHSDAVSFVVAHNHPSGEVKASPTDKLTHQNILEAGRIFKIPMMDAIIIGNGNENYYSAASSYDLR